MTPPALLAQLVLLLLSLLLLGDNVQARKVILIRHAEKSPNGLSPEGRDRSLCIKNVFSEPPLRPFYIFAQTPVLKDSVYSRIRPLLTVQPLAEHLNLPPLPEGHNRFQLPPDWPNRVDITVQRNHPRFLVRSVTNLEKPSWAKDDVVLVAWRHETLGDIVRELGVSGLFSYPEKEYDMYWVVDTDTKTLETAYQGCNPKSAYAQSAYVKGHSDGQTLIPPSSFMFGILPLMLYTSIP